MLIQSRNFPGRENSTCKGLEEGPCLMLYGNSKADEAAAEWTRWGVEGVTAGRGCGKVLQHLTDLVEEFG